MAATQKVSPDQVLDALAARPGVTAAELAEALGMGQSTAAKHLAALERRATAASPAGATAAGGWPLLDSRTAATATDASATRADVERRG